MLLSSKTRRVGKLATVSPDVLNELMAGRTVEEIGKRRQLSHAHVEKILRAELRDLSIRPAHDYAKLQIRRLDTIAVKLSEKANAGDLAAVDRLMRILERLDRYHGFAKQTGRPAPPDERDVEAFDRKLTDLWRRAQKAKPQP